VSKSTTTHGYIVAWIIYIVGWVGLIMTMHNSASQGSSSPPPVALAFYLVLLGCAISMLVFWLGALGRLGQMRAWGWFLAVLVLHLFGLGIAGMLAYAIAGPEDSMTVVIRPPMAT
jgi:hypothetical protein